VTKTITPEPRDGNAPPRIAETDARMLNAIGLANPGRDVFFAAVLPRLRTWCRGRGYRSVDQCTVRRTCALLDGDAVAVIS
jgi:dihydroorotate dehydrogenase